MVIQRLLLITVLTCVLLTSCSKKDDFQLYHNTFRSMSFNTFRALDSLPGKAALKQHIERADPDIVSFVEVDDSAVVYIEATYGALGFSYFEKVAGDTQVMFMSKYPITETSEFVMSGRNPLYCEVDINGNLVGVCYGTFFKLVYKHPMYRRW